MSTLNASKRLGLALLGAVLAAGLLAAACSTPADAASPGMSRPRVSAAPRTLRAAGPPQALALPEPSVR
ncbi:hypothetical protein ABT213_05350 [Streptomyces sp. NPDC001674]|uniref:hypothetical protein n=1 Tax=unclassified Streptomyces TaxID=2593676 RepID=UPI00332FC525